MLLLLLFIWLFDRRFYCCCCGCCLVVTRDWLLLDTFISFSLFLLMFAAIVSCDLDLPSKARFFLLRHLFFDTKNLVKKRLTLKKNLEIWIFNSENFLDKSKMIWSNHLLSFFLQIFTVFWHDTFYLKFFFHWKGDDDYNNDD